VGEAVEPFPFAWFVTAICANTTRPHRLRVPSREENTTWRWITRRYFELEEEQVRAAAWREQMTERLAAVRKRRREAREAAELQHMAAIEALLQREKALVKPVVEFVFHEAGAYPAVGRYRRRPALRHQEAVDGVSADSSRASALTA
jgi:competence protein CoiA